MSNEPVTISYLTREIRAVGLAFMSVTLALAVYFASWVVYNRKSPVVQAMQPIFLLMLCIGIILHVSAVIPLGIDDGNASSEGANMACMAVLWLSSMGIVIELSALFSKLWRVNRVFGAPAFHRTVVLVKDVIWPFAILFTLTLACLLTISIADPLEWERKTVKVDNNDIVSYGSCSSQENVGKAMQITLDLIILVALVLVCVQAYRARNISDEFSEAKEVAYIVFSWLELAILGVALALTIEPYQTDTIYVLEASIIIMVNFSILFFIFVPIWFEHRRLLKSSAQGGAGRRNVHVTGVVTTSPSPMDTTLPQTSGAQTADVNELQTETARLQQEKVALEQQVQALKEQVVELETTVDSSSP